MYHLPIDPMLLIVGFSVLSVVLLIAVIVCIVKMNKLYRRYDLFMRGKDAETLEDTLEDILEELVGEIHDEYDEKEDELVQKISDREYIIEGSMHLDDVNDHLDTELDSEDYDSLGGFIIEHLDRLPVAGDEVITEDGIRLIVEKLDKNRIEKVHVYLPEKDPETLDNTES